LKRLVILVAAIVLVGAACGGGDDGGSDGGGGANATPVSIAPPDASRGEGLFGGTCTACHGADAKGLVGLGKDLTDNSFADGLTDEELVAFLIEGRPAGDPLNTTGVDMQPRGGNADLSDQDLFDIVAYLRTL